LSQESSGHADIPPAIVEAYRHYAKFQFECGDYESARTLLSNYIALFAHPPITAAQAATATAGGTTTEDAEEEAVLATLSAPSPQHAATSSTTAAPTNAVTGNPALYYLQGCDSIAMLHVLWGRLACEILVLDWAAALVALDAVKLALESMAAQSRLTPIQALQQRTWLLHWSLFVYWNAPSGLEQLVDLFLSEKYKQAITTVAPHLLRYLTAAVLLYKRRGSDTTKSATAAGTTVTTTTTTTTTAEARKLVKLLIYVMQDCDYTDPIVEFVNCLCIKFDFDSAQEKLAVCESVLSADFFLCHQTALFMEEARIFVFENYCRIHNKIDLASLGAKLAMDQDRAERWIVDLIRHADLDAKIDSTAGCVVMGTGNPQTIHETVVERTRDLSVRATTLTQNLAHVLAEARKDRMKREQLAREQEY
jgi:translation initiation factor 3 subunit E